jgi:hypothetical protein
MPTNAVVIYQQTLMTVRCLAGRQKTDINTENPDKSHGTKHASA